MVSGDQPLLSLADYIAPKSSGIKDYVGAFAVTTGIGLDKMVKEFEADLDDYKSIMAKAVAIAWLKPLPSSCMRRCAVNYGDLLKMNT